MGYILKMLNVIKEADSPADRDKLLAKGYTLVYGSQDEHGDIEIDLSKHNLQELKAMAKDAGIKGYSGMDEAALIAALTKKPGDGDSDNGGEGNGGK